MAFSVTCSQGFPGPSSNSANTRQARLTPLTPRLPVPRTLAVHLPRPNRMFKPIHVDALSVELNPFEFQTRPLLLSSSPAQLDLAAHAQDTVPGQLVDRVHA